jgi:hypothetical protein
MDLAGNIELTKSKILTEWISPPVNWSENKSELLNAIYQLPGENLSYYGCMIGIYYKGQIQDTHANPVSLMSTVPLPLYLPSLGETYQNISTSATESTKIMELNDALKKADSGDAYAQAIVSIYYGLGLGCSKDLSKSKEYAMLSAKQQNPLGIFRLGEMRHNGEGMKLDLAQGVLLMKKAKEGLIALGDDPYALTALAQIHEIENPNSDKITEYLERAAKMKYKLAEEKLYKIKQ